MEQHLFFFLCSYESLFFLIESHIRQKISDVSCKEDREWNYVKIMFDIMGEFHLQYPDDPPLLFFTPPSYQHWC